MDFFFFSSRRRHTRLVSDWSSDVCSSDLYSRARKYPLSTLAPQRGWGAARGSPFAARRPCPSAPPVSTVTCQGEAALGRPSRVEPGGRGPGHGAAAILFTAGILATLKGPVLWCLASRDLFAPALACAGLHPDRVIYAETWRDAEVLPVMEEGVRCPGLAGVVGEIDHLSLTASRRLQLAAEATDVVFLVSGAGVGAPSRGMARELGGESGRNP